MYIKNYTIEDYNVVILALMNTKDFFSGTANENLSKLNRNGQTCSNGSDWLHKKVMGLQNRFTKCNIKKYSCLKLQDPELSYLVYNII